MVNGEWWIVCLEPWFPWLSDLHDFYLFPPRRTFSLFVSEPLFNHVNHLIILIMVQDFCFALQTDSPPEAEPRRPDTSGLLAMTNGTIDSCIYSPFCLFAFFIPLRKSISHLFKESLVIGKSHFPLYPFKLSRYP